jgi:hypothetical protein
MGKDVQVADERRDRLFTGLYEIVKGMSRFDKEVGNFGDAKKLLPFFEKAQKERSMGKKTYTQETAALERLHADLHLPANATIMNELGITDLENRLKNINAAFKTTYLASVDANSALMQQSTATEKRKPLEEALKEFYTLVDAMKKISPWTELYNDLSVLAKRAKL